MCTQRESTAGVMVGKLTRSTLPSPPPHSAITPGGSVNFAFNEEQEELRKTVRQFLEAKSPESAVREQMDTEAGYDAAVWSQMGEQLGLQGLVIPEEYGGSGYGYIELIVILEEMGRALLCAPFFSTVVLAANTLIHSGDDAAKADLLGPHLTAQLLFLALEGAGREEHRRLRTPAGSLELPIICGTLCTHRKSPFR